MSGFKFKAYLMNLHSIVVISVFHSLSLTFLWLGEKMDDLTDWADSKLPVLGNHDPKRDNTATLFKKVYLKSKE